MHLHRIELLDCRWTRKVVDLLDALEWNLVGLQFWELLEIERLCDVCLNKLKIRMLEQHVDITLDAR